MPNSPSPHRIPWIAVALGVLAVASLVTSSAQTSFAFFPVAELVVIVAAVISFFVGLTRYFTNSDETKRHSGVHIMLWSLAAFVVILCAWFALKLTQTTYNIANTDAVVPRGIAIYQGSTGAGYAEKGSMAAPTAPSMQAQSGSNYYYPQYGGSPNITDTREFNKVTYDATMRTRKVQELVRRAETTIRGFAGRVDQTSSSEKYGYITFVVPATKFDEFRTEIESFVNPRFLKIDVTSQNLLPQKQNIEQTQTQVEKNLADLQAQRKQLVSSHGAKVRSIQSEIDANDAEVATLNAEMTNDPVRQMQIQDRKYVLSSDRSSLRSKLSNENANYTSSINSIDAQIKYTNDNLAGVKQQDQNLLDNVATVNGAISFNWISLWEIVQVYLPGYWIPSIFAVLAVLAYLWERRRPIISRAL